MTGEFFDAHFHVNDLENPFEQAQLAIEAGVTHGLAAGVWWDEFPDVLKIVSQTPFCLGRRQDAKSFGVYPALGMHPANIHLKWLTPSGQVNKQKMKDDFLKFGNMLEKHRSCVFAIGETGFDASSEVIDHPSCVGVSKKEILELQLRAFEFCAERAIEYRLPLIIHSRNAWDFTKKAIRNVQLKGQIKIMIHCYSGPAEDMPWIEKNGIFVSFGGVATWNKAHRVRQSCVQTPSRLLLLETDAPDLPPEFLDGRRPAKNEMAFLKEIAKSIAKQRNDLLAHLAEQTAQNFREFLQ